jgi:hypothetical protein
MRLTSSFFVSALTRRLYGDGMSGLIEKKGAEDAGAIFIRVIKCDRSQTLLSPAPQSVFTDGDQGERQFEVRIKNASEADIDQKLARETSFDSDIWVVEIQTDQPENYMNIVSD